MEQLNSKPTRRSYLTSTLICYSNHQIVDFEHKFEQTSLFLYLDGFLYPRRGSRILCAVNVRQEHGVDQGGLSESGLADDLM